MVWFLGFQGLGSRAMVPKFNSMEMVPGFTFGGRVFV